MRKNDLYNFFKVIYLRNIYVDKLEECSKALENLYDAVKHDDTARKEVKKARKLFYDLYNFGN